MHRRVYNINVAACLLMQGHKLEGFDKKSGEHRVAFLFIHSEDLENGINDYFDGKLQIEPQEFIHRRNHLKSIIH